MKKMYALLPKNNAYESDEFYLRLAASYLDKCERQDLVRYLQACIRKGLNEKMPDEEIEKIEEMILDVAYEDLGDLFVWEWEYGYEHEDLNEW